MKVIITGASGMVGKGVLLECLDHKAIDQVLVIGRSSLKMEHPKLKEITHIDFSDFSSIDDQLSGYNACFFCLGISAAGLSEEEYSKITYDYTMALAKSVYAADKDFSFIYVSGQGTASSEKGRMMWARVKGKTENDLLKMGFKQAFMYRPGMIIPHRGIKSRTKSYQFMYDYFMWLVKLVKFLSPNSVVTTTQIGLSMINATQKGFPRNIIDPKDIIELAEEKE